MTQSNGNGTLAIWAFVCSIVSWFICGLFLAPAGLIMGIVALSTNTPKRGLAIAAVIIGALACFFVLFGLASIAVMSS